MKRVAILMSAYNGDAYIEEQIESIYAQDYKNFCLYIRDDGSDEAFVAKLERMQSRYGFVLYKGDNIGFLKSFFWLLQQVTDADYYAFADQDDIWKPEKITKAVRWLSKTETSSPNIPLLYHCSYEVRKEQGELADTFYFDEKRYDFRRSITENHYSGFAMVVNQSMRGYMLQADVNRLDYHDWWAANIAKGIGQACFDSYVGAVHRAHEDNVTKITFARKIAWFLDSLREESAIHKRAEECEKVFGSKLSCDNQNILQLFTYKRYHLGKALRKCFYPKRWRPVFSSEIAMRILMFIGKI